MDIAYSIFLLRLFAGVFSLFFWVLWKEIIKRRKQTASKVRWATFRRHVPLHIVVTARDAAKQKNNNT